MRMMWAGGVVVIGSVFLTGCGGGDGDAAPETDTTVQATDGGADTGDTTVADGENSPACELLTVDEVSDLFGQPASVVPVEDGAAAESSTCLWEATLDEGETQTIYQLQLSVFSGGADLFDPGAWGGSPEAVEDLGDEAFVVRSGGLLGTTAGYLDGDRSVFLSYAVPLSDDPADTAAQADDVVELLRGVEERLS